MSAQATLHIVPTGDLVAHDTDGTPCACGPFVQHVVGANGAVGRLVVHASLDGRELREPTRRRGDPGE